MNLRDFLKCKPKSNPTPLRCDFCEEIISSKNGPMEKIATGYACSDCYFLELGKLIESQFLNK